MADSIVRLKVENSEYDAKINRARQGLLHMEEVAQKTGRSLVKLTKDEKDFVQSLGRMETVSKDARGRVNELTKAFTDLSVQYNHLTDEEKRGEYGTELSKQLEILKQRAIEAKRELNDINSSIGNIQAPNIGGGGLLGGLDFKGIAGGLIGFTGVAGAAMTAANALKGAVADNIETAKNFELSMSHLSSLTGLTGEKLDYLKKKAIDLGGSTTQSASQVAESFMLIGSKMPELLNDADALSQVTEAAIRLAEASGGDVTTSANALTASLNIMGEGADQANRYINILAAGSQKGTRSIDELSTIVFRAGQSAHSSGMSFEELIAIAAAGTKEFDSAESAGQGLSKLFVQLEKQGNDQLKPSVVGVTEAIRNLTEANFSQVEAIKLFTVNGAAAYRSIIDNKDAILETLPAITGTNTALEQAATNTANLDGALKSLDSAWERFNLTINDSNGPLTEVVTTLTSMLNTTTDIVADVKELGGAFGWLADVVKNAALKPIKDLQLYLTAVRDAIAQIKNMAGGEEPSNNTGKKYRNRATGKVGNSVEEVRTVVYKGADGKIYKTLEEARKAGNKTVTKTYDDSTLKGIRAHINALKEERLKVDADSQAYANLTAEITRLEAKLKNPKTPKATTPKKEEIIPKATVTESLTELQVLEDQLKTVRNSMKAYGETTEEWQAMNEEAKSLTEQIDKLNGKTEDLVAGMSFDASNAGISYLISDIKTQLDNAELGSALYDELTSRLADATTFKNIIEQWANAGLNMADLNADELWQRLFDAENIPDETWQKLIDTINAKLAGKKIKLDFTTGDVTSGKKSNGRDYSGDNGFAEYSSDLVNGLGTINSSLHELGIDLGEGFNKTVGRLQAIVSLVSAIQGIVLTIQGTSTISALPFLHTGGLLHAANGVFVPGAPNGGRDTVPAMLSPGELVLNRSQQSSLAAQLQAGSSNNGGGMSQSFTNGENIFLGTNHYLNRTGQGELVTTKMLKKLIK